MAVEARHLNLFPSQILCNRDMMMMMNETEGVMNMYGTGVGYGINTPLSGTTTTAETLPTMYGSAITDSVPMAKTLAMKADSGLTYVLPVTRKRSREDDVNPLLSFAALQNLNRNSRSSAALFSFLGEDMSSQIQQQQLEIDRFIAQHTEKVKMEIEERRKRYSTRIIATVEQGIMKRLKAKEKEIERIGTLNWALEERVRSLSVENQIWRDLAQTNEATANALRSNLEQVLAQVHDDDQQRHQRCGDAAALMDDAQSCCGSNYEEEVNHRDTLAESSKCVKDTINSNGNGNGMDGSVYGNVNINSNRNVSDQNSRLCRNCGKDEACVLLLPCRHLCLCTVCGSSLHTCPICKSTKNASLHVNMSL